MNRKKFTRNADISDEKIETELTVENESSSENIYDDLLSPLKRTLETVETETTTSFKSFHSSSTPIVEHNDHIHISKKNDNIDVKVEKSDFGQNRIALGSYMILKAQIEKLEAELSIAQIAKYTSLSKSSIKKHKETWIKEGWIEVTSTHDCSNQKPPTYKFLK